MGCLGGGGISGSGRGDGHRDGRPTPAASVEGLSSATSTNSTASTSASIFNSGCSYSSGGGISGEACVQQSWLEQKPGAYYVENQVTTSAIANSGDITALTGYYYWGNGDVYTRVGWSPSAQISEGSPTTYTLSAAADGFAASVSETQYPATLNPYFPNGQGQSAFGSLWNGNVSGAYVSANSVAIVHLGAGATGDCSVGIGMSDG